MECRKCGAEIAAITIYVETAVLEEARRTGRAPYIAETKQPWPNTSFTATANMYAGWSYPCRHEPKQEGDPATNLRPSLSSSSCGGERLARGREE